VKEDTIQEKAKTNLVPVLINQNLQMKGKWPFKSQMVLMIQLRSKLRFKEELKRRQLLKLKKSPIGTNLAWSWRKRPLS